MDNTEVIHFANIAFWINTTLLIRLGQILRQISEAPCGGCYSKLTKTNVL